MKRKQKIKRGKLGKSSTYLRVGNDLITTFGSFKPPAFVNLRVNLFSILVDRLILNK